ncbi:glycosyltransferase family 2 protein [Candidatus Falkowbacteria bacterium]|nr:MAG: glycosyltransferase family 2 protein [Candidatus Falkowbacteria bacterium]
MQEKMKFSIIIVNYNTKEITKNCIDSIFRNCPGNNYEIIVVDNNSQDNSREFLENNFGNKIKLINNKTNKGFGAGNNRGARTAMGEYLFFLNSDTLINNDIFKQIENYLINNKEVGILAPELKLKDGCRQPDVFGRFPNIKNTIFNKLSVNATCNDQDIDWVSGAALVIRKNLFAQLKGFDENFFMYFEDIDLCKRIKELGYKIMVLPEISVVHLGGASFSDFNKKKKFYYQSQDYYFKKYYGVLALYIMKILRWPYKTLVIILNK